MKYVSIKLSRKAFLNIIIIILSLLILVTVGISKLISSAVVKESRILPIYSVSTDKKEIAVTFDAAWGAEDTDLLIEILNKYNAPAAFFCVGDWVDKNADSVSKLHTAGHIIANHSSKHKHLNQMNEEEFILDVRECNQKIKAITGCEPRYYRGPYGEYNNLSVNAVRVIGMEYVQWDCDSVDWREGITVDEIVKNTLKNADNGSIMLFHNGLENTPKALEIVLDNLTEKGYKFVSLDDLIIRDNYYIDNTGKQFKTEKTMS